MELPKHKDGHYEIRDCSWDKALQHQEESKIETTCKHTDSTAAIYGNTELNDHQIWHVMTFLLSSFTM